LKRAGRAAALSLAVAWLALGACVGEQQPQDVGPRSGSAKGAAHQAGSSGSSAAFRSRSPSAAELQAESCADCHAREVEGYRHSAMARALGPIEAGELAGLPETPVPGGPWSYAFSPAPPGSPVAAAIVERHAAHPQHELPLPLAFAIGAGVRDRAFVALLGQSQRFAPLEVQTHGALRRPEPAPGHSIDPGQRFSQGITPECLGCHSEALPPLDHALDLAPAPGAWTPRGIGCAACHGSGLGHAAREEAALYGELPPDGGSDLAAPSRMTRIQRLSVCAACHLQGDARILFDPRRLGIPPPGRDLLAERAVFVAREPGPEIGFVSQVERLLQSRCFTASAMVCETCHDPHVDLAAPGERQRVRDACLACHADSGPGHAAGGSGDPALASEPALHAPESALQAPEPAGSAHGASDSGGAPGAGTEPAQVPAARSARAPRHGAAPAGPCALPLLDRAGRDCAACHLRETPVFDVAHVRIHDHWIQRNPSPPSPAPTALRTLESPSGDWRLFHWPGEPAPPWADDAGLRLLARESARLTRLEPALLDTVFGERSAGLPHAWQVRASLAERLGRPAEAEASYRQALALDPEFAPAAINLALLLGQSQRRDEGLALLDGVLSRFPRSAPALRNRAVLRAAAGQPEAAAADLERAMAIAPDPAVAEALAAHYRAQGDPDRAARLSAQAALLLGPAGAPR
jgi:hypothetical protein